MTVLGLSPLMFDRQGERPIRAIIGPVSHKFVSSMLFLALATQDEDNDDEEE